MGDRCYINIVLRRDNAQNLVACINGITGPTGLHPIENEFSEIESEEPEGIIRITEYEANYAWYTELDNFGSSGFVFYGHHGSGGEYDAGCFAAHNGQVAWVNTGENLSRPTVEVFPDGFVSGDSLTNVLKYFEIHSAAYYELHRKVWALPEGPPNPYRLVKWEEAEKETIITTIDGVRVIRI